MGLQVTFPAQIDLRRFAAQRRRPIALARIDGPAAITANLARKAEQLEFLFPALCREPRLVDKAAPTLFGNMMLYELCHSTSATLRGNAALSPPMLQFLVFVIRCQTAKIRRQQPRVIPFRGRLGGPGSLGLMLIVQGAPLH